MTQLLKTILRTYNYNISVPLEREAYDSLCAQLRSDGYHLFNVYPQPHETRITKGEVILDTTHMFGDQWNTAEGEGERSGLRVFDWYEPIYPSQDYKCGYYLDFTPEMLSVRTRIYKCGYCAAQYDHADTLGREVIQGGFCTECLDSEYLKEADLHLLRLCPVGTRNPRRKPLSARESALLLPKYIHRQTVDTDSRNVAKLTKQRAELHLMYAKSIEHAERVHTGMIWLMDHNIPLDNVIYYDHTGVFSFGWRSPLSAKVAEALLDKLSTFPFKYGMVSEDK